MTLDFKTQYKNRGNWKRKYEFLLSCLGYSVGMGSLWTFPYLCYKNGGGAFVVAYLVMLFLCGIPLFFLETSLGQFAGTGCLTLFKISPLFKGAGFAMIIVNMISTAYCNVILSYSLLFLANCFRSKLPWAACDNEWNSQNCAKYGIRTVRNQSFPWPRNNVTETVQESRSPADEFFNFNILQISDGIDKQGSFVWPLVVCNVLVWSLTYLCTMKGVKSVGKAVYFTATFPLIIIFVFLIGGLMLPGARDGISFYITPRWHQLTNHKVWNEAALQIVFSLRLGSGGIINLSSYNKFRNNNLLDSILVPILNCGTSIFSGFVVFCVIGFVSHETGLPVSSLATGGPGLAFVTYPEAITMLPWPHVWAVLFFLMLFFLGLDSCFVEIETVISSIVDEFPALRKRRMLVTFMFCTGAMFVSFVFVRNGGIYLLRLFDSYTASFSIITICLIEVFIVGWTYGIFNFMRDLEFMVQKQLHWCWIWSWKVIVPSIITFILFTNADDTEITNRSEVHPAWSITLGWIISFASIICIPVYMGYQLLYSQDGDLVDRFKAAVRPAFDWGPADKKNRKEWFKISDYERTHCTVGVDPQHDQFIQLVTLSDNS